MENKQLIIIGSVVLVIVLGVLAISQSYNSPQVGGGFDFLDINKRSGDSAVSPVPTTPPITQLSGQEIKVGTGSAVIAGDTITVHYVGMFTDGRKFDSSYERNEPFTFQVGAKQVMPGFEQGVLGMKTGGKRKLIIPASLAYGEKGQGPIPPNSPLVFEVELLSITPAVPSPVQATPEPSTAPADSPTPTPAS
jgi:hypothetical protein